MTAPRAPRLAGRVAEIEIDGLRLVRGDALEVLPDLAGAADLVVTDPPYRLTSGGCGSAAMRGIFDPSRYDNSGLLMDVVDWSRIGGPILRACKDDADAYVMANDKQIFAAREGFVGAGWKLHTLLAWDKGAPTRNRWYMKNLEFALYLWKGRARTIRNPGSTQLARVSRPKARIHPTQKPVELLRGWIENSSDPGDLVLDPFAGSGATLAAALACGRRAVGIEIDPTHFEAAAARLRRERDEIARRRDAEEEVA